MKRLAIIITVIMFTVSQTVSLEACTNFLITKGASRDGSVMITYAADSHALYGELYFWPGQIWPAGSLLDIYEWDTGKYMGQIPQAGQTYTVVGNMNEHQLAIGETTFTGRHELGNPGGMIDYGSLIYITLQRAKTAREAIATIAGLLDDFGYYSTGESFSIADKNEVWIMELIGSGEETKKAVWVARRIPDGYISGHANQARISTFPLADGKISITSKEMDKIYNPEIETVYAYDVIDVAREFGWFDGKDKDFSFCDAYAPIDFEGARFCEARVWSGFNKVNSQMEPYLSYALGEDLTNRMPLWIKPDQKLDVRDVMGMMRDYFQGTPMDMTQDVGAGPYGSTVRWRPMTWEVDGTGYIFERAVSTQQTAFSFVSQSRSWLPDPVGGILWFGVDDTFYTVYSPIYCGISKVPESFAVGNGDIMTYSENAAFWVFNQMTNLAYTRTSLMMPEIQEKQNKLESGYLKAVAETDKAAEAIYKVSPSKAIEYLTDYSVSTANNTVSQWKDFYRFMFVKYLDGNVKEKVEIPEGYKYVNPKITQPGYPEWWYRVIVEDAGEKLREK